MRNLLLLATTCALTWLAVAFWDAPIELFFIDRKSRIEPIPTADAYMVNSVTRKFGRDGNPAYLLTAQNGLYYANTDRFELEEPKLTSRRSEGEANPWQLTAATARSTQSGDDILLTGNVHARQQLESGHNEFFTDDIRFSPSDNTASTTARVKLINPESTTTGKGMRADFNRETYQLLADVRGYYHVN